MYIPYSDKKCDKTMPRRFDIYTCILAVCLLLVPITGSATDNPAYQFRSTSAINRTGGQTYYGAATPSYSFKTTSAYEPTVSTSVYSVEEMAGLSGPRRVKMFNWDEDVEQYDPIGVLPNPAPIGDIPWFVIILTALGYVWWKRKRFVESK